MARPWRLLYVVLTVCALVPAGVPAAAQEAASTPDTAGEQQGDDQGWTDLDEFGEEISVDVVNLDVWVVDRKGRPVTGLERDDFELLVDGEPVEITNFDAFEGPGGVPVGGEAEAADGAADPDAPPWAAADRERLRIEVEEGEREIARQLPESQRLHLAILVDDWNLNPGERSRVFQDLRTFLADNLKGGDRVAVAVNDRSLHLVQGFTEDPAEVSRALSKLDGIAPAGIQQLTEYRSSLREVQAAIEEAEATVSRNPGGGGGAGGAQPGGSGCKDVCCEAMTTFQAVSQRYAASVESHVQTSASAIASLSQIMSGIAGQKIVLYVGNGLAETAGLPIFEYVAELCPNYRSQLGTWEQDYDLTWLYDEVAARANAAGVTLYTLEAASPATDLGLDRAGGGLSESGFRSAPSTRIVRAAELDAESSLTRMATQTGGRMFLNAADFSGDFERLAADVRNVYSLGFAPRTPGDGGLHRIDVRLREDADHEGYRVRHRDRYQDKPMDQRMVERIQGLAQFGGGVNPLGVRLEVGTSVPEEVSYRLPLRIWVPLREVTTLPDEASGEARGRLRLLMATTGAAGSLRPVRQKVVDVTVRGGEEGLEGDKLIEVDVDMPPGKHTIALAVRDDLGGTTSYLREELRIPTGDRSTADDGPALPDVDELRERSGSSGGGEADGADEPPE